MYRVDGYVKSNDLVNMLREQDILDELPELLRQVSGLELDAFDLRSESGADAVVHLGGRILVVEAKTNARAGVLTEAAREISSFARRYGPEAVPVLAVPFMGDVGRRICQDAGVSYIDLSGNAHIKAPPLVVFIQGRPNRFVERGRPSSVFAPKSSRVARLLLLDPKRWWIQQELAEAGVLGAGYVSRICKRLDAERLIDRNDGRAVRPRDPQLLLDAWQARYDFEKHDVMRGHVSARSGEELADRVASVCDDRGVPYAMTGLAAAWRLAPFAGYRLVSVYIKKRLDDSVLSSLKWRGDERGANLWLVRPNDDGVFCGQSEIDGVNCVSAVQAYLDLRAMPERADEAAGHLQEALLRWE